MNVLELLELSNWFDLNHSQLAAKYQALQRVLQNNINQGATQPLEEPLNELLDFLSAMKVGELNLQQLRFLGQQGVSNLIGYDGVDYVRETVITTTYDPATTLNAIQDAVTKINNVHNQLTAYSSAVSEMGIKVDTFETAEDRITVRVGFRNEAAINDIKDWKTSAEDWFHIVRGLGMLVGEAPEDTRVIGTSNGSIILVLSATAAVSALLALICKHLTGMAKEVMSVQITREELRQKRLLTEVMENELAEMENKRRQEGLDAIYKELADQIPKNARGDVKNALEKSIDKLVKFGENGGDVDFVAPPKSDDDEEENSEVKIDDDALAELNRVRRIISDYQEEREAIKLLEDGNDNQR